MANKEEFQSSDEKVEQTVFKEETPSGTGKKPTMSGLDENIAGLLCYVFSIVTGIIFLVIEKENKFIRFHAMQAIFTFVFFFGVGIVLGFIPILGAIVSILLAPVGLILAIFLMVQAYNGKMYKLPFIGDLAEQYSVPK